MKTTELNGAALDWAVAKCELLNGANYTLAVDTDIDGTLRINFGGMYPEWSTDSAESGAIIERERISLLDQGGDCWLAICGWKEVFGDTQLIAAMRCYVANKLGDEVQIPEALIDENAN